LFLYLTLVMSHTPGVQKVWLNMFLFLLMLNSHPEFFCFTFMILQEIFNIPPHIITINMYTSAQINQVLMLQYSVFFMIYLHFPFFTFLKFFIKCIFHFLNNSNIEKVQRGNQLKFDGEADLLFKSTIDL